MNPKREEYEDALYKDLLIDIPNSDLAIRTIRELLGYVQLKNGDAHPSLFLEAAPKPTLLLKGETQ
jgi:hypothetical protein